jgi:putative hydrolase of the HAD superfamily
VNGRTGEGVAALLFDLGRVVIDIDVARAHARWAELAGVPVADIVARSRARIAESAAFHRHERGEISDVAFFAHLREVLEIDLTEEQVRDGWNAIFVGEMPGIRPLLLRARQALPLYAFSNTNAAHQACWQPRFADVLAPFRRIYASHEIGARKPEAAAYQAVAADMGVAPHRILFFDDMAANVAAARASGMRAVQVTAVAVIEQALADLAPGPCNPPSPARPAGAD